MSPISDNVAITAGSGTTVATDDAGSAHYQKVKLVDGTADSTTVIPGGASGLYVQGPVADDAAAGGNPVYVGGLANSTPSNRSAGDMVPLRMDLHGCAYVQVHEALPAGTNNIGKIDLDKIAGASVVVGNGSAATSLRVTMASDSTGQVALAAGTAGIGKLTANSGVDIGDVDVTSIVPGSAATNLGKAEDAAHSSGDVGVMALGVRNDALAALSGSDGDYTPLATDATGTLITRRFKDVQTLVKKTVDFTASQTAQTIWQPATSKYFVITDIVVSASAAGVITIFDHTDDTTNRIAKLNLAANGGAVLNYSKSIKGAVGTGTSGILKYTTGSVIAGSITVHGYETA